MHCDSELRAVEAGGESRDELCLCQQTQLKLNRRLTGGTRVTSTWQWPSDDIIIIIMAGMAVFFTWLATS